MILLQTHRAMPGQLVSLANYSEDSLTCGMCFAASAMDTEVRAFAESCLTDGLIASQFTLVIRYQYAIRKDTLKPARNGLLADGL